VQVNAQPATNKTEYLYFEILRYRIVFYAAPAEVIIISIRHTKMEPKKKQQNFNLLIRNQLNHCWIFLK
jgi:plasmid stabilization system protein ParE